MNPLEATTKIVVAMIGEQHTGFLADKESAEDVANAFEIIYTKVATMYNKPI